MKIHRTLSPSGQPVEYWYDPHCRCWFAAVADGEGNLIGPAESAYRRDQVLRLIADGCLRTYD